MKIQIETKTDFIDLGLPSGLKWAKCNVGAKTPTECGNYFRWGEITDAREMVDSYDFNKPFEDAATYHMGKEWRMPTKEELKELYDNTISAWVENYQNSGVSGRLFASKVNGQMLFFPAAGYCNGGSVYNVGTHGNVWSSSLNTSRPYYVYGLRFISSNAHPQNDYGRYVGRNVRGVKN